MKSNPFLSIMKTISTTKLLLQKSDAQNIYYL